MIDAGIRERAIEALRIVPGALTLYEFGSHFIGNADAWSDVDLQLISEDVHTSVTGRAKPFLAIAPVALEWTFLETPTTWAATVLFSGISPFCHLDIGFSPPESSVRTPMLRESVRHWAQRPATQYPGHDPAWYSPEMGRVEHVVMGDLLGLIRYVKARRRGQDLLCWKFFSALANRVLEATYLAHVDRDRGFGKPLPSHEHTQLRKALPKDDIDYLTSMTFAGDETSMDGGMIRLGHELVRLGGELSDVSDSYRTCAGTLMAWIECALLDEGFNDALS